jgi:hypothetical protein
VPIAAVHSVKCVEGCGGDSTVAIVGIVVGVLSFLVAIAAVWVARRSLGNAEEHLGMARTEHSEFMRQLNARADLEVEAYLHDMPPMENGALEASDAEVTIRWRMGIKNIGAKPANDVGVNFLVPQAGILALHWAAESGQATYDPAMHGPMTTSEELVGGDHSRHPAQYLIREIRRVTRRSHFVFFAGCRATMPEQPGQERTVPYKFKVWSDDLPDDVEASVFEREVTLRRVADS